MKRTLDDYPLEAYSPHVMIQQTAILIGLILGASDRAFGFADIVAPQPGIVVSLYDIGTPMQALPTLAIGELPNVVRVVTELDLQTERGDFKPFEDSFVTELSGILTVEQDGTYAFRLISDDGSKLWIDDRVIIDHDGLHGSVPKDGTAELTGGINPFRVSHFEAGGGESVTLLWKTPGMEESSDFVAIPPSALSHTTEMIRATAPGKKRIIPPLRKGRPGDGTPVAGMHPGFQLSTISGIVAGSCAFLVNDSIRYLYHDDKIGGAQLRQGPEENSEQGTRLLAWLPPETGMDHPDVIRALSEGAYSSHIVVGDAQSGAIHRVFLDTVDSHSQGCAFRFAAALPWDSRAAISVESTGASAFELRSVRAMANGFELEFTKLLDARAGWDRESYLVEQWPWKADSRPIRDGTNVPVKSVSVSPDRRSVFLEIEGLKEENLVYFRLLPPCLSEDGDLPWTTEAWYTLIEIPQNRIGMVLSPPAQPAQNLLSDAERAAGWQLLFDGQTTNGWRGFRKDSLSDGWQAVDGCLVRVGSGGDIVTEQTFDSFELRLDWRISPGGNSGIFFRVSEEEDTIWKTGPEFQILDNTEHADGKLTSTSAGSNYALHAPTQDFSQPVGLFNESRIVVNGDHVEHWMNGHKIVEYTLNSPEWEQLVADSKFKTLPRFGRMKTGHIALQDHGDKVWFRNIKVRRLP